MPHLKVFKHFVLLQHPDKFKFIVIFWFSKNKGKTWIRDQKIVSYQKYYIGNFLSKAYFGFTGFTQNIFLNLACVLSFTPKSKLLRMWLSWTLCFNIFPPKTRQNFLMKFDITFSTKPKWSGIKDNWPSHNIYRDIILRNHFLYECRIYLIKSDWRKIYFLEFFSRLYYLP